MANCHANYRSAGAKLQVCRDKDWPLLNPGRCAKNDVNVATSAISLSTDVRWGQIMKLHCLAFCICFLFIENINAQVPRQQVTVATPFHSVRDSFYESTNVNWRAGGSGAFVQFGNPSTLPPFGNPSPNAGIRFGFGNGRSNFNFNFSQGSSRSFTSTTPVLTLTDGVPGSMFSGRMRPFVTGYVPITGFGNVPPQPTLNRPVVGRPISNQKTLVQRLAESRAQPEPKKDKPVRADKPAAPTPVVAADALPMTRKERAQAKQTNSAKLNSQVNSYLTRGAAAERAGKTGAAKIFYQMAAKRGTGTLKQTAEQRLEELANRSEQKTPAQSR